MTELHPIEENHPLATLISWPAVFAGAVVAVTVGAMLNILGVALGAGALNPFDLSHADAKAFTVGAGLWIALANTIALFVGGFVASRAAKYADRHQGMLHGLAVWALAFLLAILVAGMTTGGGVTSVLHGAADNADTAIAAAAADTAPPAGAVPRSDGAMVAPDGTITPPGPGVVPAPVVQKVANATATIALWAFVAMLLGGAGAVFGGRYGARKHAWEHRRHLATPEAAAPPPRF